jgi:hypothetical protein
MISIIQFVTIPFILLIVLNQFKKTLEAFLSHRALWWSVGTGCLQVSTTDGTLWRTRKRFACAGAVADLGHGEGLCMALCSGGTTGGVETTRVVIDIIGSYSLLMSTRVAGEGHYARRNRSGWGRSPSIQFFCIIVVITALASELPDWLIAIWIFILRVIPTLALSVKISQISWHLV